MAKTAAAEQDRLRYTPLATRAKYFESNEGRERINMPADSRAEYPEDFRFHRILSSRSFAVLRRFDDGQCSETDFQSPENRKGLLSISAVRHHRNRQKQGIPGMNLHFLTVVRHCRERNSGL
jgi:hypothetical protein